MKFTLPTVAFALTATTSAQIYNESAPFRLQLVSYSNSTVNGSYLAACHSGAAIESLCLADAPSISKPNPISPSVFTFNSSDSQFVPNATLGVSGVLVWVLHGSSFNYSESMGFSVNPSSNVVLPLFGIGQPQYVAFDEHNLLNIQDYVDDTTDPATVGLYKAYYNWYSCTTYFTGYSYVTLAWALGVGKPQNPTCVKVDVKRIFV
ncbi:hypothetical protein BCR34DRAFT_578634 [Clohesyomyces aquaticus]|uniref:DUF7907 domain-containing protein n=1 Tax=Clohesyomyces aquaticus TaxID=1231657 RepID=A0A1Y1YET7_9PLEO|nr:hypothetical protein BCR34DRAFT_578634 [Clohesyomyces aquaticus]